MPSTTPERIADAALRRFNRSGYASTTLVEIANDVGISPGNLTYHFPAKLDLALYLSERVRVRMEERRGQPSRGDIATDYIEQLYYGMEVTWTFRFPLRDRGIFEDTDAVVPPSPILVASFDERRELITRIDEEGWFRSGIEIDLDMLARSLWILSRYWMDHLREMEQRDEIEWVDVHRGIQHHLAILLPLLTAAGRHRFVDAAGQLSNAQ